MNCPNCFTKINNFEYQKSFGHLVKTTCQNCKEKSFVDIWVIFQELIRLIKVEKAVNNLHFILSSHPTIQRLSALEDSTIDEAFCELEKYMNFETNYQEINK